MKTYLVTGAAGFIGANFIKYMLKKYEDIQIVVLDLLTYAGNLGTIAEDIDGQRCCFVKGDIGDRALADQLFAQEPAALPTNQYLGYSKPAGCRAQGVGDRQG